MKDLKKIQEFFSKPLDEGELKLGIKYDYKYGDSGYISTGGSKNPGDWKFLSGEKPIRYSYLDVKADLVRSKKQPGKYDRAFDTGGGKGHHIDENNGFTSDEKIFRSKDEIYSLISQALQQGKLTKDAQDVFMKWIADPNSTEEAIIKALKSIMGDKKVDEVKLLEAYVPSNIKEFAKRKGVSSLVNKVAGWAERVGARITGGTAIGKNYNTLILDMGYQTADIYINIEDGTIELYGEPADSFPQFKEAFMNKVTRDEIKKDEDQFSREQGLEETLVKKVMERLRKS